MSSRGVAGESFCGYCDGGGDRFWVSSSMNLPSRKLGPLSEQIAMLNVTGSCISCCFACVVVSPTARD